MTQFLAEDKARLEMRARTLQEIEEGHGDAAQMAEVVATAIVHCHLHTLDRLGIDYDLLTRESEILHLKFWDAAFEMLKAAERDSVRDQRQECRLLGDGAAVGQREDSSLKARSRRKKPKRRSSCGRTAR